jgi:hypothetical protein
MRGDLEGRIVQHHACRRDPRAVRIGFAISTTADGATHLLVELASRANPD